MKIMQKQLSLDRYPLAHWIQALQPSALQDLLAADNANMISFALGLPSEEFFPVGAFQRATAECLAADPTVLQYGTTTRRLKQHIVRIMHMRGVQCREEQIFLTAGAQQGLSVLSHLLLQFGGQIVTESLTYTGIMRVVAPLEPTMVTVPTSKEEGIDVNALEYRLRSGLRPAFIYLVADGHNPLGVCISRERQYLADLVQRYQVPLIEDDPYGFLSFETALPPVRAFNERWVFYVGSLSKILSPALRIGWIIAPEELISKLSAVKEAMDLDIATFAQHAATWFLDHEDLAAHLRGLQQGYRRRRDLTEAALKQHIPAEVSWCKPGSGMYFWLELPSCIDTGILLKRAVMEERVAFTPGHAFCADHARPVSNCLRVCFSHCPLERIEEGLGRLGRVIHRAGAESLFYQCA